VNYFAAPAAPSETPSFDLQEIAAVDRINSGDHDARFRSVVLPHLDDAYTLACWLTRSRTDSEDVVQEACLRAFRAIGSYSTGNARAWVLTIVRNTAFNWMRTNRRARLFPVEDLESVERAQSSKFDAETPEAALIAKNEATRLKAAIAALPDALRETLVLRDIQGFSYREIAEVSGTPVGTVMSRLARARSKLIGIMSKNEAPGRAALS
jgi:RNA polymerase sigma factor (sigma-70 family)